VGLSFGKTEPENFDSVITIPSALHASFSSTDHRSIALNTITCSNLTRITLKPAIRIERSIFQGPTHKETPFSLHLEYFKINLSVATATCRWYVEEVADPLDVRFCPDRCNPSMLAIPQAVHHMPMIKIPNASTEARRTIGDIKCRSTGQRAAYAQALKRTCRT
jgi:hypothetical protein